MKKQLTRGTALLCALLLSVGCLCGCDKDSGKTSKESGATISMEDLEYGATLRTDKGGYALPLQFDKRFFPETALTTLANYYYAIQTNDVALFQTVQQPCFLNYNIQKVYENKFTVAELVQSSHDTWAKRMNGDYAYALIYAKGCITESTAYSNIPTVKAMLDDAATQAGEKKISDGITTMYELTIDLYLTEAGSGETGEVGTCVSDTVLFMYEYQGGWYVVY